MSLCYIHYCGFRWYVIAVCAGLTGEPKRPAAISSSPTSRTKGEQPDAGHPTLFRCVGAKLLGSIGR